MTEVRQVPHVRIHYTSEFAPHEMRITTRPPVSPVPGAVPQYESWAGPSRAGDTMVEALITDLLANMPATSTIVSYDIYDAPDAELPPVWLYTKFVTAQIGTLVEDGESKAVSYMMSFRCADGNILKNVTLDTPVNGFFGNVYGLSARDTGIAAELLSSVNAWAGFQGAQPLAFTNITVSLNKRLRRKYDMI